MFQQTRRRRGEKKRVKKEEKREKHLPFILSCKLHTRKRPIPGAAVVLV